MLAAMAPDGREMPAMIDKRVPPFHTEFAQLGGAVQVDPGLEAVDPALAFNA